MWTAVLVLAIAVNFEPTRIGLIALMLSRPKPLLQLLAFLGGGVVVTTGVGLFVLFVAHRGLLGDTSFNAAKAQITIGAVALVAAAVLASKISFRRFAPKAAETTSDSAAAAATVGHPPPGLVGKLSKRARVLLQGDSPWFSLAVGLILALPSVEYMALLVLIAASESTPTTQAGALIAYVAVANAVAAIPLVSYLVAPIRTRTVLARFYAWIRARRRRDWAVLVAVAGLLMIGVGIKSL